VLAKIVTGIASDQTTLIAPDPREATGASLFGYPVRMSSQITLTEGATSIGSWAALLDTSQIIVTERRPPTLEVSRHASFSDDRIAVRATWRGGLAVLNPEAISLVTDVRAA
jgi:HK97 family phage major capsid protein